jgi:hypothetical protein
MSEEFLQAMRQPPRREFVEALYAEISRPTVSGLLALLTSSPTRRLATGLAALALLLAAVFAASPAVRAAVAQIVIDIGGLRFQEIDDATFSEPQGVIVHELVITPQAVSISEAEAMLPFTLTLPTWVPDGLLLQEKAEAVPVSDDCPYAPFVEVRWCCPDNPYECIRMRVECEPESRSPEPVGTGSVEEVDINGLPGALVKGALIGQSFPGEARQLTWGGAGLKLKWKRGGLIYSLYYLNGEGTYSRRFGGSLADDLIRMAESMAVVGEAECPPCVRAVIEPIRVSLAEARAAVPFVLPSWTPHGFELQEETLWLQPLPFCGSGSVLLTWQKAGTDIYLQLWAWECSGGTFEARPPWEELTISGQSAWLAHRGAAGSSVTGFPYGAVCWRGDGVAYVLSAGAEGVPESDLLRMAESMLQ